MLSHSINSKYISNIPGSASTLLIYFGPVQTGTKGLLETGEVYPLSLSLGLGVSCAEDWIDGPSNGSREEKERERGRQAARLGAGRTPQFGVRGSGVSVTLEAQADPLETIRWSTGPCTQISRDSLLCGFSKLLHNDGSGNVTNLNQMTDSYDIFFMLHSTGLCIGMHLIFSHRNVFKNWEWQVNENFFCQQVWETFWQENIYIHVNKPLAFFRNAVSKEYGKDRTCTCLCVSGWWTSQALNSSVLSPCLRPLLAVTFQTLRPFTLWEVLLLSLWVKLLLSWQVNL